MGGECGVHRSTAMRGGEVLGRAAVDAFGIDADKTTVDYTSIFQSPSGHQAQRSFAATNARTRTYKRMHLVRQLQPPQPQAHTQVTP